MAEQRFIDDFTNRAISNADEIRLINNRLSKIEKYLGISDVRYICAICRIKTEGVTCKTQKRFARSPKPPKDSYIKRFSDCKSGSFFNKTLYCDKCDHLYCIYHYCKHLKEWKGGDSQKSISLNRFASPK
jgi:hypothetical protein